MRDAIQIVAIDTVANVVCHDTCDARNAGRRLGQMLLLLLMMSITSKKNLVVIIKNVSFSSTGSPSICRPHKQLNNVRLLTSNVLRVITNRVNAIHNMVRSHLGMPECHA